MFNANTDSKIKRLVTGLWNGDMSCFMELYSLTIDDTYNYCMNILDDEKESLRAVYDIYSIAVNNILKLKDPSLFVAWLRRISFDVCYQIVVAGARTDLYTLLHPDELLSLPFLEREIFFLHDFAGLTEKEIVNALHIHKKHAARTLLRAREHMMQLRKTARV